MGKVKTFGEVDQRSLEQLERCMAAGDADYGVLCADHHPGYSQPIGGGIAYEGHVSPSGVGYDIGCIAAGARVTSTDGFAMPIERVSSATPVACLDSGRARDVDPHVGAVPRGRKPVLELRLVNGRSVRLTADHRVMTPAGWVEAAELDEHAAVLCQPYVGLAHAPYELEPALIRVLAYVCGDGHVSRDGKQVTIYTVVPEDA